jgi:hypothetical protein
MVFDIAGCIFRVGVIPGGIFIHFAIDYYVEVRRSAFPWTYSGMAAGFEERIFQAAAGKVDIASTVSNRSVSAMTWPFHFALGILILNGEQGLLQIGDQIVSIFQANV